VALIISFSLLLSTTPIVSSMGPIIRSAAKVAKQNGYPALCLALDGEFKEAIKRGFDPALLAPFIDSQALGAQHLTSICHYPVHLMFLTAKYYDTMNVRRNDYDFAKGKANQQPNSLLALPTDMLKAISTLLGLQSLSALCQTCSFAYYWLHQSSVDFKRISSVLNWNYKLTSIPTNISSRASRIVADWATNSVYLVNVINATKIDLATRSTSAVWLLGLCLSPSNVPDNRSHSPAWHLQVLGPRSH